MPYSELDTCTQNGYNYQIAVLDFMHKTSALNVKPKMFERTIHQGLQWTCTCLNIGLERIRDILSLTSDLPCEQILKYFKYYK
jgi:hypothetical protein